MSKYSAISNYNVINENFNNIIKEFNGYLLGLSNNDILLFADGLDNKTKREYDTQVTRSSPDNADKQFIYNLAPKIFDRTTGAYFVKDYVYASQLKNVPIGGKISDYLHILYREEGFTSDPNDNNLNTGNFSGALIKSRINDSLGNYSVNAAIPYYNGTKAQKANKVDKEGKELKTSDGQNKTEITGYTDGTLMSETLNGINQVKEPDRFKSPSLTAQVIRVPQVGVLARNASHMPIFFGGIPPIEMSRCTPYLDVKIISTEFDSGLDRLNNVSFMRFTRNKEGQFVSEDGIGLQNTHPVGMLEEFNTSNVSHMDLFTSPQTMANANINRTRTVGTNTRNKSNLLSISNQNNPVYEPISPFATLNSFDVSITGAGIGLLASKSGTLSITIHDRSRLADIEPLIAVDRFATTKIQIEFGWSHPDGAPGSDNLIGQYLNGLKDVHVYQVLGSDYNFGDGGAVDCSIKLVAYGFRNTTSVHAGSGPYVPVSGLTDLINQAVQKLQKRKPDLPAEVRQKLRVNTRASRSLNAIMTWDDWSEIGNKIKNKEGREQFVQTIANLFDIKTAFGVESAAFSDVDGATGAILSAGGNKDENKETLLNSMFGKLAGLKNSGNDPFVYSLHKDANYEIAGLGVTNFEDGQNKEPDKRSQDIEKLSQDGEQVDKYISLGKLLLSFVGWPMTSTCLYDEVQLIFYPLNHHAGAARIHTTASLPIPFTKVEKAIVDHLNKSPNITVQNFFNLIERKVLANRLLPAYGFSSLESVQQIEKLRDSKTTDQKVIAAYNIYLAGGPRGSDSAKKVQESIDSLNQSQDTFSTEQKQALAEKLGVKPADVPANQAALFIDVVGQSKTLRESFAKDLDAETRTALLEYFSEHVGNLRETVADEVTDACATYYSQDGLHKNIVADPKFVRPNFNMLFETVPAIDPTNVQEAGFFGSLASNLFGGGSINIGDKLNSNGLTEKTILKIHVYDEESVASPSEATLMSALTSGVSAKVLVGSAKQTSLSADDQIVASKELIDNLTFFDAKEMVKRSYPTIIYGSSGSTIKNISVSANTSGDLANVLMVENYPNLQKGQVDAHDSSSKFEEVTVFPSSVTLNIMGNPLINRGMSFFIDFGTNTSLDSIYTVKSVDHTISSGEFNTKVELVPSNMGAITSFRKTLARSIGQNVD